VRDAAGLRTPGAIVVGGHVNGLGLVRALAARRIPTAVIATKPYDIAQHSRWCVEHAKSAEIEERPEQLIELLEQRARDWAGWALFPANDGALAALARHHERLSATYRVIASSWEITRCFLDKTLMLEAARAVGFDLPHCYGAAVPETAGLSDLRYPVIVKPNVGHRFFSRFGSKLFVAHDRGELDACIGQLEQARLDGQVFDLIPGGDGEIYAYCTYLDRHGEPHGGVTIRKLRQSPPLFGVARVAEIVDDVPALCEATIELARHLGHRGMAVAEFKLDPRDGRYRFLEINARSVIYNGLLRRAGLDLAGLAWSEHVRGRPEAMRTTGWRGVWIHLHSDLLYSLLYDGLGSSALFAPYRRPKVYAVWSAADPLPFAAEWSLTVRTAALSLWNGTHRDLLGDRTRPPNAHSP
jgi:D-aspartate ligase